MTLSVYHRLPQVQKEGPGPPAYGFRQVVQIWVAEQPACLGVRPDSRITLQLNLELPYN